MGDGFFSKLKVLIGIEEIEEDEMEEEAPKNVVERQTVDPRGPAGLPRNDARNLKENKDSRVLPLNNRATGPNQFKMIVRTSRI